MIYNSIMEDSERYIIKHMEDTSLEFVSALYAMEPEYFQYFFNVYHTVSFSSFVEQVKADPENVQKLERKENLFIVHETSVVHTTCYIEPMSSSKKQEKACHVIKGWWHDANCKLYYFSGTVRDEEENFDHGQSLKNNDYIKIPSGNYEMFRMMKQGKNNVQENMQDIIHYVYSKWIPENKTRYDAFGLAFEWYQGDECRYYIPLLSEDQQEPPEKVYGVDTWTKYIDDHLNFNLTTTLLADKFHYSPAHFKRVFREYYDMSVSDYIRKKRLTILAGELRNGKNFSDIALEYGFRTYNGFSRAFQKNFNMTPKAYSKGIFEVVDLADYYGAYKDKLIINIVNIKGLKMIGHTVIPNRGDDTDIPAQIQYWIDKDFPCQKNTRFAHNKLRREDKIAMWYHEPEYINIEYILGPVVEEFTEDIPKEMIKVHITGGKYAIFKTNSVSDKENLPDILRMFSRCVFYGWIKEHRSDVDLMRFTFERYIDNKVYIYVPLK